MKSLAAFLRVLGCLLLAASAYAQRDLGTITGTVTDPQGGAIANAKVTITEDSTGQTYEVTTGDSGDYVRPLLKPGTYTITVEAAGFRRVAQKNVVIAGGDRVGVPITLQVGDVTQSVEVAADAPLLQTESTTLGASLGNRTMS